MLVIFGVTVHTSGARLHLEAHPQFSHLAALANTALYFNLNYLLFDIYVSTKSYLKSCLKPVILGMCMILGYLNGCELNIGPAFGNTTTK
jgi:hypothetical protein